MNIEKNLHELAMEFKNSQELLIAVGNEVRQHILMVLLQQSDCNGMRVDDIAKHTNLSRPAVSHHIQILKRAGIMGVRHEGTKNFYYFEANIAAFDNLINMLVHVKELMSYTPNSENLND